MNQLDAKIEVLQSIINQLEKFVFTELGRVYKPKRKFKKYQLN
jgi:hypothetical protein